MVTKLKNFSYRISVKIAALILLGSFLLVGLWHGAYAINAAGKHGATFNDGLSAVEFWDSQPFAQEMFNLLGSLQRFARSYPDTEASRNGSAFQPRADALWRDFTASADERDRAVAAGDSSHSPDYYFSEWYIYADTRKEAEQKMQEYITKQKKDYLANFTQLEKTLGAYQNVKYALIHRESGRVYTNLPLTAATDDFAGAVVGMAWCASLTNANGFAASRSPSSVKRVSAASQHLSTKEGPGYSNAIDPYLWLSETIDRAYDVYIGVNPTSLHASDKIASLYNHYLDETNHVSASFWLSLLSIVVCALCLLYLFLTAGRHRDNPQEVTMHWADRFLYCDLSALLLLISGYAFLTPNGMPLTAFSHYDYFSGFYQDISGLRFLPFFLQQLFWLMLFMLCGCSLLRHYRNKTILTHSLLYKYQALLRKGFERLRNATPRARIVYFLSLAAFAGYSLLLFGFGYVGYNDGASLVLAFGLGAAGLLLGIFALNSLRKIMDTAADIRAGKPVAQLNPRRIFWLLRRFANDLASMQEGMNRAVEAATREQRMKAELITNVSHDLKTPLTSLVTYVDLLRRSELPDEDARGYVEVLEEKSARLKTLVEDLVEASKATSGTVELHPVCVNLGELAMQAVGENSDAFTNANLELRLAASETPITVLADSQKTWRVVENLFQNARKYALPGTRVYLSTQEENGFGIFLMKNISRDPIDVPVQELTQRFVRGDSARSSDGSGLGLSIADGLCTIQGGKLVVTVDGDLFTAAVKLPLFRKPAPSAPIVPPADTLPKLPRRQKRRQKKEGIPPMPPSPLPPSPFSPYLQADPKVPLPEPPQLPPNWQEIFRNPDKPE